MRRGRVIYSHVTSTHNLDQHQNKIRSTTGRPPVFSERQHSPFCFLPPFPDLPFLSFLCLVLLWRTCAHACVERGGKSLLVALLLLECAVLTRQIRLEGRPPPTKMKGSEFRGKVENRMRGCGKGKSCLMRKGDAIVKPDLICSALFF